MISLNNNFFLSQLSGKTVLVTGADGFIGSHLVDLLLSLDVRVIALVHNPPVRLSKAPKLNIVITSIIDGSLSDQLSLLTPIDYVVHLAATGIAPLPISFEQLMHVNVIGTHHILKLSKQFNVKRFIYFGSCFEYGNGDLWSECDQAMPLSEYGLSKNLGWLLAQQFMRIHHLNVVGLRPFYIYGHGDSAHRFLIALIRSIIDKKSFDMTLGTQQRDFVHVSDCVRAVVMALLKEGIDGEVYNIASAKGYAMQDVVNMLLDLTGHSIKVNFGAIKERSIEWQRLTGSTIKAKEQLGFEVELSLEQGLIKMITDSGLLCLKKT